MRFLLDMLRIRRVEYRVAEIPILAVPVLLTIESAAPLRTSAFWEGVLVLILLFSFGDMINCLADRDLDAVYKPHLSQAVYRLGVRCVAWQVAATAAAALGLAVHLSWRLGRWTLLGLVAMGLALGAAYSVEPVRLKGRGLAQLACLWLIIFVGPMLFAASLIEALPSPTVIAFAALYGALQMGVILVNTAEDYPEDRAAAVRTTIVALGLRRGVALAAWLALGGSLGVLGTLAFLFVRRPVPPLGWTAWLAVAAACGAVTASLWRLKRQVAETDLEEGIRTVKSAGRSVPVWVTAVAWTTLAAALVLFRARTGYFTSIGP
jgi:4-hydroxybenzoate polyprenyltransferase